MKIKETRIERTVPLRTEIDKFAKTHPNFIMSVRIVGEWNYEFAIEGINLE